MTTIIQGDALHQHIYETRHQQLGPYLIGCVLNLILMGVLAIQGMDYFRLFPNDSLINKSLVWFLLAAGLFQSACFFEMLYYPFVNGFGNVSVWDDTHWTWWSEPVVSSIIAVACQAFFLHRCWRVTRSWIVITVAGVGMAAALSSGVACTYYLSKFVRFTASNAIQSKVSASIWLATSTATDIFISLWLVLHLRKQKRKAGFKSTDQVIRSILSFTLKTAALTSVWVTINLILYAGVTHNFVWAIFQFNMGKIYSHSVLYTLLSRVDLRSMLNNSRVIASSSRGPSANPDIMLSRTQIRVRTEVHHDVESGVDKNIAVVAPFEYAAQARTYITGGAGGPKDEAAMDNSQPQSLYGSDQEMDDRSTTTLAKNGGAQS